ncbi:Tyrosine-protein phosphatase SIW14, partial [Neolecta irregularis DAH-3]
HGDYGQLNSWLAGSDISRDIYKKSGRHNQSLPPRTAYNASFSNTKTTSCLDRTVVCPRIGPSLLPPIMSVSSISRSAPIVDQFVCGDLECRCRARSSSISSAPRSSEDPKTDVSVEDSQALVLFAISRGSDAPSEKEFVSARKASTDADIAMGNSFFQSSLRAPPNFGVVSETIYRSSFPMPEHFEYLKSLNLRSIVCLVNDDYPQENLTVMKRHGIEFFQIGMPGNKQNYGPSLPHTYTLALPKDKVVEALNIILDERNHPLLIHCNRGKHRTGCVVASLRKLQRWATQSALEEYSRYAHPKEREMDCQFIGTFSKQGVWGELDTTNIPEGLGLHFDNDMSTPNSSLPTSEFSSSAVIFSPPWSLPSGHEFTFNLPPLAFSKPFSFRPTPTYVYMNEVPSISGSSESSSPTGEHYFKPLDGDGAPLCSCRYNMECGV